MKKIYFLCSGSSNRAQIAEGFAKTYLAENFECISTSYPDEKPMLNAAINVMREIGIDISNYSSPPFSKEFFGKADYVISICEDGLFDVNFIPTQAKHIHIQIEEPLEYNDYFEQLQSYRYVRDKIGVEIKELAMNPDFFKDTDNHSPMLFK